MAWNPSPEVAVARDAANKLTPLIGAKVNRTIIMFTTDDGRMGYVSYGCDRKRCAEAKELGDRLYDAAETHFAFCCE